MPLVVAAAEISVPFRHQLGTAKGKMRFREVKLALLARLKYAQTRTGNAVARLHQRRLVAVLGDINDLQPRWQLAALRQGITTATQVVCISDGARGLWRFFEQSFAAVAVGI